MSTHIPTITRIEKVPDSNSHEGVYDACISVGVDFDHLTETDPTTATTLVKLWDYLYDTNYRNPSFIHTATVEQLAKIIDYGLVNYTADRYEIRD